MANFQVMLNEVTGSAPFQANNNNQKSFLEQEAAGGTAVWEYLELTDFSFSQIQNIHNLEEAAVHNK